MLKCKYIHTYIKKGIAKPFFYRKLMAQPSCDPDLNWLTAGSSFRSYVIKNLFSLGQRVLPVIKQTALNPLKWASMVDLMFTLHWKLHLAQMGMANLLFLGNSPRLRYPKLMIEFMRIKNISRDDITVFDSTMFLNVHNKDTNEKF